MRLKVMSEALRFAIVAHPRCGSHMVASALESRGDVECDHEPFSITLHPYGIKAGLGKILGNVFKPKLLSSRKAVGFVIHRRAQGYEGMPGFGIWDWLRDNRVPVVLLGRFNHVRRFVSNRLADKTRHWCDYEGRKKQTARISMDVDKFKADVAEYRRLWDEAKTRFSRQPVLELFYENILADPEHHFEDVQRFLGLDVKPIRPRTFKQESRPLHQTLKNYDQVLAALTGTEFERFIVSNVVEETAITDAPTARQEEAAA